MINILGIYGLVPFPGLPGLVSVLLRWLESKPSDIQLVVETEAFLPN